MVCPYLEYREDAGDQSFDAARAYCTAADRFVQPMRADICNDRYGLQHAEHCEIFREHAGDDVAGVKSAGTEESAAAGDTPEDEES